MSRKHIEIDPECGRRLKSLIVKNGISQLYLAGELGYEPQHISNIVRGKRRLTPDLAQEIVYKVFPHINVEWLLCKSDCETIADKEKHSREVWEENQKLDFFYDKIFRCFIDSIEDLCGYGLHSQGTDLLIGDYIAVSDTNGKKVGAIPAESFDRLRHEIENFASYSINQLIKNEMVEFPKSVMGGENDG